MSPPAWEAEIEITMEIRGKGSVMSPPAWEAGIEILARLLWWNGWESPPAWEAGIEMPNLQLGNEEMEVASRMGGGD